jgi:hypothetical protein
LKTFIDWSAYEDAGMGDAYADIPKTGGDSATAVAVRVSSDRCDRDDKGFMCPSYRVSDRPDFSTGRRVRLLKAALNGRDPTAGRWHCQQKSRSRSGRLSRKSAASLAR